MVPLDEICKEFLIESQENLDQLDRDLVTLERDPGNRDVLASVFRTIHTIKGTCGFFDFHPLGAVAHAGENLLSKLRDGELRLTPAITTGLLALVDAVRAILARVEQTGSEGEEHYLDLIAQLNRLQAHESQEPSAAPAPTEAAGDAPTSAVADTTIRVDVALLDKLMNRVGELVLARNQLLQYAAAQSDPAFLGTSQRFNLITSELQEGVMKTRMQPIATIWNKFPRVLRDLARECGKEAALSMEGKETELDKSIMEAIKDPLTHLLRNAVDHGIEPADVRVQRGKPAEGRVCLRAFHEGGHVNIEIADDGGGIDPQRLKQKALERGLINHDQAIGLGERELLQLIFLPGFSTAQRVTSVSGRGVGMDVVKTNIERISGCVEVQSRPGAGTTVKIKIPLTLAIIPALLVTTGGDRYAIPQVNLLELVRLEGEQALRGVEFVRGAAVYRLRGNLLPLVYLSRQLQLKPGGPAPAAVSIVVLQAGDRTFGLVVDDINDTEEIVVKPLGRHFKGVPLYAGATILGDGRVALILDVMGLAQAAGVVDELRERAVAERGGRPSATVTPTQTLLLLGVGASRRLAVPLGQVARLEEIPVSEVECTGVQEAVPYRGQVMPLVRLADVLPGCGGESAAPLHLQVVVYICNGRRVGLIVGGILDIVEVALDLDPSTRTSELLGAAVIQGRLTDVLDIPGLMSSCVPAFHKAGLLELQEA